MVQGEHSGDGSRAGEAHAGGQLGEGGATP